MTILEKLQKIISLEIEQGYENKAVIGGLEGILAWWPEQARQAFPEPGTVALIDQVTKLIGGYGALPNVGERRKVIDDVGITLTRMASGVERAEALPANVPQADSRQVKVPQMGAPQAGRPQMDTSDIRRGDVGVAAPAMQVGAETGNATPATSPNGEKSNSRLGIHSPVTVLSGIGVKQAARLKRLGIETIQDMLYFFPRRHDDYSRLKPINQLSYGEMVTVIGTIRSTKLKRHRGGAAIVNTVVADGSGMIQATWFNQPYLAQQLKRGRQIVLSGKVDEYLGRKVMTNPRWEPLEAEQINTGRLVPVYPLTEGLNANWLRKMIKYTVDYWSKRLPDYLPLPIRERLGFMPEEQAVAQMHFPSDADSLARAYRRLAFDEFFVLQLGVLRQRQLWQAEPGVSIDIDAALLDAFLTGLPYQLTDAQRRALNEIVQDIQGACPMSRLLQGDVGSGKTVVAAAVMLLVAKAGYQATIMAPTEILAEQHWANVGQLLAPHGISVRLLTGSVPQAEKEKTVAELASGDIDVLVGTHAVIQADVQFARLALAVIDEQHRFGVRQRGMLRGKGYNPHMLVMSATPIPRTLALTAYGDLDLSIIDEMPPGRQPIQTKWFMPAERERAYRFLRSQVEKGRQAYIVCPLVEESDKIEAKSALQEHQRLQESIFPNLRLGLLHGRLKGEEKERVMRQFSEHQLDILVSTSVVEVGIDVPNATVMMIEGANRFGLSQLHQFRGRVGRGEHPSFCILMADTVTDVGEERLRAIEETQDGFVLAQRDLEMRGPGDFFGTRQSGLPELKLASLGDTPLLELARREAQAIFGEDPALSQPKHRLLAARVAAFWGGEGDLS